MKILAFDTTTEICSVALLLDNTIYSRFEYCSRTHANRILPLVEKILLCHQLTLEQLNVLAFGQGPGSFTGIRVGICTAQGLAFGANLPLLGISTLMTLAESTWQYCGSTNVLVAIDAHMGEIYWAEYQRLSEGQWFGKESESILKPETALLRMQKLSGTWVTAGTGWKIWPKLILESPLKLYQSDITAPMAKAMIPLAKHFWIHDRALLPEKVNPIYLRNKVAWKSN